jgi:hypothetical protein
MHAKSFDSTQLKRHYTTKNVSMYELACLAINELDKIDYNSSVEVIIESQPSKNPKMKNFSMMLLNYFIIRYMAEKPETERRLRDVKFINSRNKLTVYNGPYVSCSLKGQHARNKYYGKMYCRYLLRNNIEKIQFLNTHKKTDDLCDSFLQGAWYLLNNCKIKHVQLNDDPSDDHIDPPDDQIDPTDQNVDHPHPKLKLKIKLRLKKGPTGRELLNIIKHSPITAQIHKDYNVNKYRRLVRGRKPQVNTQRYNLSHIKYIIDHKYIDFNDTRFQLSLKYYFGDKANEIIGKNVY